MELEFHPLVASDIAQILQHYEQVAGPELADAFYRELREHFHQAPESYNIRARPVRRVNLARFPYHFLFRLVDERVRILVVRHHSRDPALGRSRR